MKKLFTILLILITNTICAESDGWVNRDGTPAINTDNMKSIGGFGGWLIVTPDKNWAEKWETTPDTTPHFSEASDVHYGEELTILPFYINPKVNELGEVNIHCNIKITKPNGKHSINQSNIPCGAGKLHGNPRNIRLTTTVIKYIGENSDLPGTWVVEVTITDKIRNISIPLKSKFKLIKNG